MKRRPVALAALLAVAAAVALAVVLAGEDRAPGTRPAAAAGPPAPRSSDSEAPPNAPAHWLPPEDWVYNHWLPYDEQRLYSLLRVSRGAIWRHLREDSSPVAQLAARRGWPDARRLAAALVAPWSRHVSARQLATLRSRALRTLTQGHLAQHVFFHSLHQFAIPSAAPDIFGVTDAEFRRLRRAEQSPLEIGRLRGRSPALIEQRAAGVLRERVRHGVRTNAMTARQGELLLRRQLSQLPRWLAQERYNGPPPTSAGRLTTKPRDYASNPALTADGGRVVYEAYLQKLPKALKQGEISVRSASLRGGAEIDASFQRGRRTPRSAYNASVSADGRRIAFEAAEGNQNFAKRYGEIRVFVHDTITRRTRRVEPPAAKPGVSRSEYNPALSADGRVLAYQALRGRGNSAVYVTDLRSGRTQLASRGTRSARAADRGVYHPSISGDGSKVAFTTAASNLGAGPLGGRTQVFVRDLAAGTTTLVSRAGGAGGAVADDYSSDPAISQDGRYVAFSSTAGNLGGGARGDSRIYVRDLVARRTIAVSDGADGFALKPSISADGRRVAYATFARGVARVVVRDTRGAGPSQLVSRASGPDGVPANGASSDPAISADGRRVAFSSTATNLAAQKSAGTRGVFVRDLRTQRTQLVSAPAAGTAASRPEAGAPTGMRVAPAAAPRRTPSGRLPRSAVVSVFDNAFHRGRDRPAVRLVRGGVLTWRFSSQQSHQVTAVSPALSIGSPAQTAGSYSARLTKPGVYAFVCAIHAPGMRMTAVVR